MKPSPNVAPLGYLRALLRRPNRQTVAEALPELERTLPAQTADERRLEAFRRLTGYPDNGYLPLTWPHIAAFPGHLANLVDPRFPLPLVGTVHVASRVKQWRPIGAGEALRCVCRLENSRKTDKGLTYSLVTRGFVGAELVWEGAATMLRRAARAEAGFPDLSARPALDGIGAVSRVWQVPERTARAFALASGDLNPIHLSRLVAQTLGFKGLVIHGMWSLTRVASMHPTFVVQPNIELTCDFKLPVVLPAQLVYRHWPLSGGGGVAFRLLDRTAARPHAIGQLRTDVPS